MLFDYRSNAVHGSEPFDKLMALRQNLSNGLVRVHSLGAYSAKTSFGGCFCF